MLLAVDIGNTKIAAGLFEDGGKLRFTASFRSDIKMTADQCAIEMRGIFSLYGEDPKDISGAIVSSVVPPITAPVCAAIRFLAGKEPMVLGPGIKTGLDIRLQNHPEVGQDIVACAVAALRKYEPPMIIVDFGTAITFSAISANSAFLGGAIYPGVSTSLNALSGVTANLPLISPAGVNVAVGRGTIESMRSGIVFGTAGMVDNIVGAIRAEIGGGARVIATGERMDYVLEKCKTQITFDNDLLMEGLYYIYRRNT